MNLRCKKCDHRWKHRYEKPPGRCPSCKRPDWRQNGRRKLSPLQQLVLSRINSGRTQKEMADRLGVSVQYLCAMEKGQRKPTARFYIEYEAL